MKRKIFLFLTFLVFSAFFFPKRAWAYPVMDPGWEGKENCDSSLCPPKPKDCCRTPENTCSDVDGGGTPWNFYFNPVCKVVNDLKCTWVWHYSVCSSSDRCEGGNNIYPRCVDYTEVSNSSGNILAGQCSATQCPNTGCQNGGHYKTCCKYNDLDGSGGPSVNDTLTGAVSNCSNCLGTDCCKEPCMIASRLARHGFLHGYTEKMAAIRVSVPESVSGCVGDPFMQGALFYFPSACSAVSAVNT